MTDILQRANRRLLTENARLAEVALEAWSLLNEWDTIDENTNLGPRFERLRAALERVEAGEKEGR